MGEEAYKQAVLAILLKLEKCSKLTTEEIMLKGEIQMKGASAITSDEISGNNLQGIQQHAKQQVDEAK